MDSEDPNVNLELVTVAINKLIQKRKNSIADDEDDQLLLSQLLAQLESVKQLDEVMKEINKLKRQNVVTHWLLSTMIVMTVIWQISEVSLLFKLKNGVTEGLRHPFKQIGGMLARMIKRPLPDGGDDDKDDKVGTPINIPELEFPDLTRHG